MSLFPESGRLFSKYLDRIGERDPADRTAVLGDDIDIVVPVRAPLAHAHHFPRTIQDGFHSGTIASPVAAFLVNGNDVVVEMEEAAGHAGPKTGRTGVVPLWPLNKCSSGGGLSDQSWRMAEPYSVFVPWENVRGALDLLTKSASGHYKPRPLGNRAVIDFEREDDALLVTRAFAHTRLLKAK
ncbi:MAG TPA: hypothetical protein VF481_01395 [Novosphingobium sp.]